MIELSEFWQGVVVGAIVSAAVSWFMVALADIGKEWDLESENTYLKMKIKEGLEKEEVRQELKEFFRSNY